VHCNATQRIRNESGVNALRVVYTRGVKEPLVEGMPKEDMLDGVNDI